MTENPNNQTQTQYDQINKTSRPELLAPAGDMSALKAAVGNGADAVYLGAGSLNARRNAANFGPEELAAAIGYAHQRAVRVYLALNTLIADDEGDEALDLAAMAYAEGIDAVILQDVGLAAVLHEKLPDLPLFASTQMTIHDLAGLQAAARLGISRVILPRELSLAEIRQRTAEARQLGLETEVFIHGAQCVSYSGQCLLSSLIGGRSGNRGECAQPCRLPWQIAGAAVTGSASAAKAPQPWLSPRDQTAIGYLAELADAGVASLKIEGRMRGAGYVGQTVAVCRAILDRTGSEPDGADKPWQERFAPYNRRLLQSFNRGGAFADRYISGRRQIDFLAGSYSGSHGLLLGTIIGLEPYRGILRLMLAPDWPADDAPGRGDVLSIRRQGADQETASAPIGEIIQQGRILLVRGFHPDVLEKLQEGDPVYRMTDRKADQLVTQADQRRTGIRLAIGSADSADNELGMVRLSATILPGQGRLAGLTVETRCQVEAVEPLAGDRIAQQLKKAGNTPFRVEDIVQESDICLTIGGINNLRRQLLDDLAGQLISRQRRQLPARYAGGWQAACQAMSETRTGRPGETDLSGQPGQIVQAGPDSGAGLVSAYYYRIPGELAQIACGADRYYLPILGLTGQNAPQIREAIRAAEPASQVLAWLPAASAGRSASLLPGLVASLAGWGFDGLAAGNPGLDLLPGQETEPLTEQPATSASCRPFIKVADTSANIFNQAAASYYAGTGAAAVAPSLELSASRLAPMLLAAAAAGTIFELPVYGRLRLMTSEFCPIGQNLPSCQRCHRQPLNDDQPDTAALCSLKDRKQQVFPLLPHPRVCTSEIFSHFLLSAAYDVLQLLAALPAAAGGNPDPAAQRARLYFLDESPAERQDLTSLCARFMKAGDPAERQARADEFQQYTRLIAARLGCQTSRGHYQHGV